MSFTGMGAWRQKEVVYIQGKKNIQLKVGSQVNTHSSWALWAKQIPVAKIYSRFLFKYM